MHYASIRRGRAADDSGKYHPVDHLSATDLAGYRREIPLRLPFLYLSSRSTDFRLPSGDMIRKGVRRTANAMNRQDPLHSSCYLGQQ